MVVVRYSPVCDGNEELYALYLLSCLHDGESEQAYVAGVRGGKYGNVQRAVAECLESAGLTFGRSCRDGLGSSDRGITGAPVVGVATSVDGGIGGSGDGCLGCEVGVEADKEDTVDASVGAGVDGVKVRGLWGRHGNEAQGVVGVVTHGCERGKNYARNQVWREKKKKTRLNRKAGWHSSDWRSPGSVESSGESGVSVGKCWTVKEESAMERRIREALEKKKAVEAELAAKKAELALERMNDKTMTDLYNARVKQEGISRMNQATQRSEKSLEQLRSVSPGSSATPGEIREALLCSETWKLKEKKIRAWIADGRPEGGDLAILDEGKDVEAETLNTEERGFVAEWAACEIVEEERVEPSDLEKANVAAALLWSQKKYIAFVARRCRAMGKDPESGLLGPEIGVYRGMTAEEFADFDAL